MTIKKPFSMGEDPQQIPSSEKPKSAPTRVRVKDGQSIYYGHGTSGKFYRSGEELTLDSAEDFNPKSMEEAKEGDPHAQTGNVPKV